MKLVDALKYRNELSDYLKDKTGTDRDDDLAMVTVSEYLASGVEVPNEKSEKNKIAVYYAYGDITESAKDGIASDRVVPDILKLADDDDIEAMVGRWLGIRFRADLAGSRSVQGEREKALCVDGRLCRFGWLLHILRRRKDFRTAYDPYRFHRHFRNDSVLQGAG